MDAAANGVAEEQDEEYGIDQQDVLYRMVLFLATVTVRLFSRVLGADNASFRSVMSKRGGGDGPPSGASAPSETASRSREGAGGGISEAAQRREQCRQQDMDPLVGFALAHAEQPPLDHLNGTGLQVGEQEEQPIFRRCQRAGPVNGEPTGGSRFPIKRAPR